VRALRCEACGREDPTHAVDFGDGQRAFQVCQPCARMVRGDARVAIRVLVPAGVGR
jgi:hypothetical protein